MSDADPKPPPPSLSPVEDFTESVQKIASSAIVVVEVVGGVLALLWGLKLLAKKGD